MTDTEKILRNKIAMECWSFEGNFSQMDIFEKMKNDWHVARKNGDYSFENCPSSYDCLSDFVGLCEGNDGPYNPEQCKKCWKKALSGGDDI